MIEESSPWAGEKDEIQSTRGGVLSDRSSLPLKQERCKSKWSQKWSSEVEAFSADGLQFLKYDASSQAKNGHRWGEKDVKDLSREAKVWMVNPENEYFCQTI